MVWLAIICSFAGRLSLIGVKDTTYGVVANLYGRYTLNSHLDVGMGIILKLGKTPSYPAAYWVGSPITPLRELAAGDWTDAWLSYRADQCSLRVGRWQASWGVSPRYSLVLNDTLASRNGLYISWYRSGWGFEYFISFEPPYRVKPDDPVSSHEVGDLIYRTLVGHRLIVNWHKVELTLAELAYFPGSGYLANPILVNPFIVWFFLQHTMRPYEWERELNALWQLSISYKGEFMHLYGELMIDDIPYVNEPPYEPPQMGYLIGCKSCIKRINSLIEYTCVYAWTYLGFLPWWRYEAYGYPLGHPYGPDFDEIFVSVRYKLNDNISANYSASYVRKGEPDIHTNWPIKPYGDWDRFPPGSDFLWGTIEYHTKHDIGLSYDHKNWSFKLNVGLWNIRNLFHKNGTTFKTITFSISLTKRLSIS